MTPAELEARIRVDVEAAKAEGWSIANRIFLVKHTMSSGGVCCALSACVRKHLLAERERRSGRWEDADVIRSLLELSDRQFQSFISGFDAYDCATFHDPEFHDLGVRMRRLYVDGAT